MRYRFLTADVFTDRIFGGNPLAVIPDARGLSSEQMHSVAREFNLSETVFVLPAEDGRCARRLRIFTPSAELAFAGHPTVGTALILAALGELGMSGECSEVLFQEGVGPVHVAIRAAHGRPYAQLTSAMRPEIGPAPPPLAEIAAALSLAPSDIEGQPVGASCGVPFLFVPLRDRATVGRSRLDPAAWGRSIAGWWAPQLFVYSRDPLLPDAQVHARMYSPAFGVPEDPATGAAAVALAGVLALREPEPTATYRWVIEQGVEMGRPSRLEAEADKRDGVVTATRVGGSAVIVSEGLIEVP